ncbi:uncharacterized protein V6R79_021408 [Siganus canaliculatus]
MANPLYIARRSPVANQKAAVVISPPRGPASTHHGPVASHPCHGAVPASVKRSAQPNPLRFRLLLSSREQHRTDVVPLLQSRQPGWKQLGLLAGPQAQAFATGQQTITRTISPPSHL